eukprot:scaffold11202_cov93-Isochrysis_galbana.AAC.1
MAISVKSCVAPCHSCCWLDLWFWYLSSATHRGAKAACRTSTRRAEQTAARKPPHMAGVTADCSQRHGRAHTDHQPGQHQPAAASACREDGNERRRRAIEYRRRVERDKGVRLRDVEAPPKLGRGEPAPLPPRLGSGRRPPLRAERGAPPQPGLKKGCGPQDQEQGIECLPDVFCPAVLRLCENEENDASHPRRPQPPREAESTGAPPAPAWRLLTSPPRARHAPTAGGAARLREPRRNGPVPPAAPLRRQPPPGPPRLTEPAATAEPRRRTGAAPPVETGHAPAACRARRRCRPPPAPKRRPRPARHPGLPAAKRVCLLRFFFQRPRLLVRLPASVPSQP